MTKSVKAGPCGELTFEIYDKDVTLETSCDDGENPYTHMEGGECAQACIGTHLGPCPIGIVTKAGNLTEGTCEAAGYPKDTGMCMC